MHRRQQIPAASTAAWACMERRDALRADVATVPPGGHAACEWSRTTFDKEIAVRHRRSPGRFAHTPAAPGLVLEYPTRASSVDQPATDRWRGIFDSIHPSLTRDQLWPDFPCMARPDPAGRPSIRTALTLRPAARPLSPPTGTATHRTQQRHHPGPSRRPRHQQRAAGRAADPDTRQRQAAGSASTLDSTCASAATIGSRYFASTLTNRAA